MLAASRVPGVERYRILFPKRPMFTFFLLLISLTLFALLVILVHTMRVLRSIPRIGPDRFPRMQGAGSKISVILPARNEERRIEACLRSLLDQDYPHLEIRVVDDRSTDRTAEIVRAMERRDDRVSLIQGQVLPPGWLGKPHAIWQGVKGATGEYFCFVDCDVSLHPQCIRQALSCMEENRADLLTLGMRVECKGFWEKAVQPLIVQMVLMWFPADKVNDPDSEKASANGPFLLFRRAAYEAIGGHEAAKDEIVEDLVLARKIKENRLRLFWVLAPDLISVRMYDSLKELWEGWTKNFFKSLDESLPMTVLGALGILCGFIVPWLLAFGAGWQLILGPQRTEALCLFALSAAVLFTHFVQRKKVERVGGITASPLLLQPLGALVVLAILANSAFRTLSGRGIRWKGRTYRIGKLS